MMEDEWKLVCDGMVYGSLLVYARCHALLHARLLRDFNKV